LNKAEVSELLKRIKYRFSMFQVPDDFAALKEMANDWHESLKNVPYEVAQTNLRLHAASEKFPPSIADLAKPSEPEKDPSSLYHESMRASAVEHLSNMVQYEKTAVGPTPEQRERVYQILGKRSIHNADTRSGS
jgi:hypothetical protein